MSIAPTPGQRRAATGRRRDEAHTSSRPSPLAPRPSEGGIALVIVMISILVLTTLAAGFAYSMKVETKLARNATSEAELEWLGRSGVEYARWILAQQLQIPNEPYDGLDQVWAGGAGGIGTSNSPLADIQKEVQLGNGSFTWTITDLERKFNINAPEPVLTQILPQALTLMGVDPGSSTPIVNSILDWIDPDDQTRPEGAETEYYQGLSLPYAAKNGPIDDLSELLLIKGITPELYWGSSSTNHPLGAFQAAATRSHFATDEPSFPFGLVDVFTPLSDGKININTASAEVLEVIPGVDPLVAEAIVSGRAGQDDGTGLMGPYRNVNQVSRIPNIPLPMVSQIGQYCDVRSRTFRVEVDADVGGYKRTFYAILGRNSPRDVQILCFYWK